MMCVLGVTVGVLKGERWQLCGVGSRGAVVGQDSSCYLSRLRADIGQPCGSNVSCSVSNSKAEHGAQRLQQQLQHGAGSSHMCLQNRQNRGGLCLVWCIKCTFKCQQGNRECQQPQQRTSRQQQQQQQLGRVSSSNSNWFHHQAYSLSISSSVCVDSTPRAAARCSSRTFSKNFGRQRCACHQHSQTAGKQQACRSRAPGWLAIMHCSLRAEAASVSAYVVVLTQRHWLPSQVGGRAWLPAADSAHN